MITITDPDDQIIQNNNLRQVKEEKKEMNPKESNNFSFCEIDINIEPENEFGSQLSNLKQIKDLENVSNNE